LNRFIGEARDDAQAVEVQQFSRQTTTYGLGLGNCLILIRCTNHHSRSDEPSVFIKDEEPISVHGRSVEKCRFN
jgi:hypothetical protein